MKYLAILPLCFLLTGCAFTKDYVNIDYHSQTVPLKIEEANNTLVEVNIIDLRADKGRVGCKKNGYGQEMAPIVSKNDVAQLIKDAITAELQERGFTISEGENEVQIEIHKFSNDFKLGFWSAKAQSESVIGVTVRNQDKAIKYSKTIYGVGEEGRCIIFSGKNACTALERALAETVHKIVCDQEFINALIMTNAPHS